MKINKLKIEGVGGISNIELSFNSNMNILCGPNGVGKTTVLEAISHSCSNGSSTFLKRNANLEKSKLTIEINANGKSRNIVIEFDDFEPDKYAQIYGLHEFASKMISLRTNRTFNYIVIQSITRDPEKEQPHTLHNDIMNGVGNHDIKSWFVHRFLYSAHSDVLSDAQKNNFELAKKCFSLLNNNFSFYKVDVATNDIMVNTPSGIIYYEYLSSGFKSIISILFGIIKEIEFRFKKPQINAEDFDGIILIDEIELHLHPEWQESIVGILLQIFPNVQFFVSTHSPHVIQTASRNHIIALSFDDNNNVFQRQLPLNEFGFQGWSIEEVLSDVMGMPELRTVVFNEYIGAFEANINEGNYDEASQLFDKIDSMLHPNNSLKKLLKFQLISIKKEGND